MAQSNVIREFLVALGFKLDEPALKRFSDGVGTATKAVIGLAAAVETTAVGVAAGIARFASNLEQLYFASVRTGTSVANIKAFGRAAQDFGASADEAMGSIEGLAHAMRENPFATRGLLAGMGVNPDEPDKVKQILQMAKWFRDMPTNIGLPRAAQLGISENTYLAIRNGDFEKRYKQSQALYANGNWQKAAEDAHQFGVAMRDLMTVIEAFGLKVWDALQNRLHFSMQSVTAWIEKNGPWLANRITTIGMQLWDVAEKVAKALKWVVEKFVEWDAATGGWSTKLLAFLVILKFFGGGGIIGGILGIASAFIRLGAAIVTANSAAAAGAAAGGAGGAGMGILGLLGRLGLLGAAGAAGYGIGFLLNKLGPGGDLGGWLGGLLYQSTHKGQDAYEYFRNQGWSKEQAAGIVSNINAESGFSTTATGDNGSAVGLLQWHADRQAIFKKQFGKDLKDASFEEQMAFINYELRNNESAAGRMLRNSHDAYNSGSLLSRYYVRPADADSEAARRGQSAVSIQQDIDIHVNGSADAAATAKQVVREQKRQNEDLTRTMTAAVK